MGIYPPANDICQDAEILFKDRPELIRWVYGEAWETSSVKSMGADFVWCLANRFEFGIITIAVLPSQARSAIVIRVASSCFARRHRIDSPYTSGGVLSPYRRSLAGNYSWR